MARYTIKEIFDYCKAHDAAGDLMFARLYDPPEEGEEDNRPVFIGKYVDLNRETARGLDKVIVRDFGDWLYIRDCDDVESAFTSFAMDNYVYTITHVGELAMINKAFTTDFNPLENYDRYEELKRRSRGKSEASNTSGSKTSPDFVASGTTFYDTAQMDGTSEGKSCAEEMANNHIHGNIGVTQAVDMLRNTVDYFYSNSLYETFIKRLLEDSCMLIV